MQTEKTIYHSWSIWEIKWKSWELSFFTFFFSNISSIVIENISSFLNASGVFIENAPDERVPLIFIILE